MAAITSRSNEKIKFLRSLYQRKNRKESGKFLVEGIHHVGEAIEAHAKIDAIFYAPSLLTSQYADELISSQVQENVPCYETSKDAFLSISGKENPQGILALVNIPKHKLNDFSSDNAPWWVAITRPQDPGNIGTILRTIDAVGANGLILLDGGTDPYHPNAVRASMGTIFWYPVIQTKFEDFLYWVDKNSYHLTGSSAHGDTDFRAIQNFPLPRILLMGSEQKGLSPEQMTACEKIIRIPMQGRASSLNLAVSTGILLYAMLGRKQ